MQVTPPSDPSAKPAPGGPPQTQDKQGSGAAEQAIEMIQQGFGTLSKMMQGAGSQIDPQDIKLFQAALQATDNFIQALTSPAQEGPASKSPPPGGPMPTNANANAKPAPQY